MEQPSAGVVSHNTQRNGSSGRNLDSVTTHWICLGFHNGRVKRRIIRGIVIRAIDYLHLVAVNMAAIRTAFQHKDIVNGLEWDLQRMCVGVAIFQSDLYCAQMGENEARGSICSRHRCIRSESKNTEDRGYER